MPRNWHCPQGHRWDADNAGTASKCPSCGKLGTVANLDDATLANSLPPAQKGFEPTLAEAGLVSPANPDPTLPLPPDLGTEIGLVAPSTPGDYATVPVSPDSPPTVLPPPVDHQLHTATFGESSEAPPLTERQAAHAPHGTRLDASSYAPGEEVPHHITLSDSKILRTGQEEETDRSALPSQTLIGRRLKMPTAPPGYEILGELGRGGMGVVYKARQIGLNRLVALKMILAGGRASIGDLSRFRLEAEAVARMQHPSIVQIYEVGDHEGQPFFSLEFVDGGNLADQIKGNPQPAWLAAAVVRQLAEAMEYAHRRGIVHRDLKPANVLLAGPWKTVTTRPAGSSANLLSTQPKVTDFGLAKQFQEDSAQTREGAIMGTPSYMAPEQARGRNKDIGPPADVYALGAILYDLLTGGPPFRGETVMDTLQQVLNREPLPPTTLQEKVPRDIETICLKCLEKEIPKRYATAGELAEDLRRYLDGEPIQARPVSVLERAWKWARRRPAAAALLVVSALGMIALAAGGFVLAEVKARQANIQSALRAEADRKAKEAQDARDDAENKRELAVQAEKRADNEKNRAEANFRRAIAAVDEMLGQVGRQRLAHEPRMEKVRRELLKRATDFYEQFLDERADDPNVRWQTANSHRNLGDIYRMLGRPDEAEKHYRRSIGLLDDLLKNSPKDMRYREDQAASWKALGGVLTETRKLEEAESLLDRALEARNALAKEAGADPVRLQAVAVTAQELGQVQRQRGRLSQAESTLRDSLRLQTQLVRGSPQPVHRQELARTNTLLGTLLQTVGRTEDARQHFHNAQEVLAALVQEQPAVPEYQEDLALVQNHLGHLFRDTQPTVAEKHYREAVRLGEALVRDFPATPAYRQALASSLNNLGVLLQATGRREGAEEAFQKAVQLKDRLAADVPWVPDFRRDLAASLNNRGIQLQTQNRLVDAEPIYRQAVALLRNLVKDFPDGADFQQELARTLLNQAALQQTAGKAAEAETLAAEALAVQRRIVDRQPRATEHRLELARMLMNQAALYQLNGKASDAEKAYRLAIDQLAKLAEEMPVEPDYRHLLALASGNLGNLLRDTKRPADAIALWERSRALLAKLMEEHPRLPTFRRDLANALNEWAVYQASEKKFVPAAAVWKQAREIQEALVKEFPAEPAHRQELARTLGNLGVLAAAAKNMEEAEKWYRQAIATLEPTTFHNELLTQMGNLNSLLNAAGRADKELTLQPDLLRKRMDLLKGQPAQPVTLHLLSLRLHELATWFMERNRPRDARIWLEEAVLQETRAVEAAPMLPVLREALMVHHEALVEALLRLGDYVAAAKNIGDLAKLAPANWPKRVDAALLLARCAALVEKDAARSAAEKQQLAMKYGEQAIELLRVAVDQGFKDAAFFKKDDFAPLRSKKAFQDLQRKLGG